ncbi:MAG: hypothetical protein JKY96_00200 [Phycisphaerales bacterium]|nr:hypothetical protein [Phycisphaerales bacterium]
MLSTIANIYHPSARPTLGRIRTNRQYVYGCTSLWEVIERIQLANGTTAEQLPTTHVYGLGIDDDLKAVDFVYELDAIKKMVFTKQGRRH